MTQRLRAHLTAAAIAVAAVSTPAAAESPFAAMPVSDTALHEIRGTFSPNSAFLSPRVFGSIQDAKARDDFRFFGSIGSTMMDVWWGEIGAGLIAANAAR